ncbi:hypothetical protein COT42_06385 [Candidatus Saganbacteria bacterium CG08_land_8_20_14_0_20_45_16]|uniref:Uncharacterized protein n=1 Tax=Candidatus Saganbacteria bacterium CG08_land_8_20_14_0_20_45_16 TaxID=2014293 RepID=A0A2H0XVU4_UNCSA|nr:MAG: hypothetical protein COT42_06385 [Candidatus Saganbacteria bacterium CG08_land_8_20_14_0_20_45_16]
MCSNVSLGFKYERKRIKRKIKLPPLCIDYEADGSSEYCKKANLCKNATTAWEGEAIGTCRGGIYAEERERRKEKFGIGQKKEGGKNGRRR